MRWRLDDRVFELREGAGYALLYEPGGRALHHDYTVTAFEQRLVDGGYRLGAVRSLGGRPVGEFQGFAGGVHHVGLRECEPPAPARPRPRWRLWPRRPLRRPRFAPR